MSPSVNSGGFRQKELLPNLVEFFCCFRLDKFQAKFADLRRGTLNPTPALHQQIPCSSRAACFKYFPRAWQVAQVLRVKEEVFGKDCAHRMDQRGAHTGDRRRGKNCIHGFRRTGERIFRADIVPTTDLHAGERQQAVRKQVQISAGLSQLRGLCGESLGCIDLSGSALEIIKSL